MFMSFDEIVDDLMLYKLSEEAKQAFRKISEEDLVLLHHSIGQSIRYQYMLWSNSNPYTTLNYQPEIVDGVDVNPKHPDNFSSRILKTIWKRMQ